MRRRANNPKKKKLTLVPANTPITSNAPARPPRSHLARLNKAGASKIKLRNKQHIRDRFKRKEVANPKSKNYNKANSRMIPVEVIGKNINSHTIELNWLWDTMTIHDFINKGTIFYGPTETGKTVFIHDMMYKAKDIFHKVFIYAPTNEEKHDFDIIVPPQMVFETFGINEIENLYNFQRAAANIFNTANKPENLKQVFAIVATKQEKRIMDSVLNKRRLINEKISRMADVGKRKRTRDDMDEKFTNVENNLCKICIRKNKPKLRTINLPSQLANTLEYIDYNPHVLVIFDDAMMEIKEMVKKGKRTEHNVIKNFFFKGRHAKITHFYAFQDDSGIDSDLRKNAHFSVFTDENVANAFFKRTANDFSDIVKKQAKIISSEIFKHTFDPYRKHQKMIYARLKSKQFYYQVSDQHDTFHMCAPHIRAYCDLVQNTDDNLNDDNPYYDAFKRK